MRKHLILNAVLVGFSMLGLTQAQTSGQAVIEKNDAAEVGAATVEQPLFDDDGGRVFIVRRAAGVLSNLRYHGGEVISQPRQYNIFLGIAWLDPSLRRRETIFSNLLSQPHIGLEQVSADGFGVKNIFLPSENQEQPFDFTNALTISDLQVQSALDEMFKMQAIQGPTANTIYMVFLPPGINAKLGSMIGGKHFTAYHNFFHSEQGEVHYVVVPFETEAKLAKQSAARALIEGAVNPKGNGWY
jgi:hypothetical protein